MTVIDISTREPTDRAVTFSERVVTDFLRYCDDNGVAIVLCMIEDDEQSLYISSHSYSEDMIGILEVCQSRINRNIDPEAEDADSDIDLQD